MKRSIRVIDISYFSCALLCLWMIFPILFRNLNHIVIVLIFIIWCTSSWAIQPKIQISTPLIAIFIYLSYIVILRVLGISQALMVRYYQQFFFWFPYFLFLFYIKHGSKRQNERFVNFILLASIVTFVWNVGILIIHPDAVFAYIYASGKIYLQMNVGETTYSFYVAIIFILAFYIGKNFKRYNNSLIFVLALVISSVALVILMSRTITIITIVIGIVTYIFLELTYKRSVGTKLVMLLGLMLVIIIAYFSFSYIVEFLIENFAYGRILDRLNEINSIVFGRKARTYEGSGTARIEYIANSINTWKSTIKTFFFGIGYLDMRNAKNFHLCG